MSAEDKAAGDRDASQREVIERKVKPGGSVREFRCELLSYTKDLAVIRFRLTGPSSFQTPVQLPAGAVSDGWFWRRRPYSLYRMRGPDGELIAHRFDAVRDVRLSERLVEYHDLVLDWWVLGDGRILEEDRDELEELLAAGTVSEADAERARQAALIVLGRYRHILDEVAALETRLGIWPTEARG